MFSAISIARPSSSNAEVGVPWALRWTAVAKSLHNQQSPKFCRYEALGPRFGTSPSRPCTRGRWRQRAPQYPAPGTTGRRPRPGAGRAGAPPWPPAPARPARTPPALTRPTPAAAPTTTRTVIATYRARLRFRQSSGGSRGRMRYRLTRSPYSRAPSTSSLATSSSPRAAARTDSLSIAMPVSMSK